MKHADNLVLDAALEYIDTNADELVACSQPPTTYVEAHATYKLADVAIDGTDIAIADGDTSGRKLTVAAQAGIDIDATGICTHYALTDTGNSNLLLVTEAKTVRENTAQAGAASTITLDAAASASDDEYNDYAIVITGGTGVGQTRMISDYVGATKVATVSVAWTTQPDATSTFRIVGQPYTSGNKVDLPAFDYEIADPI